MRDFENIRATSRYPSLDGLRGIAALVVLMHHCLLVSPQLSSAVDGGGAVALEAWVWWTTFTPLHLIWAGREAVYVFFVLSGFVLTLPLLRAAQPSWRPYYARRLIRIYLPVCASIVFALLMAGAYPRTNGPEFSSWLNLHDEEPNAIRDILLLGGAGQLNSPLWSLQWEMVFSLLLPLYWLIALRFRRSWLLGVSGLVIWIGIAEMTKSAGPVFLPMFGIGALMAIRRDALEQWAGKVGPWGWRGLITTSMILLCSDWLFPELPVSIPLATIGGVLLLFIFIGCNPAINFGSNLLIQGLGQRSFSLYLVHEPIVVSVAFTLRASDALQVALVAVPLSLVAAEAFYRLVERPSHRLAGWVGRSVTPRDSRRDEPRIVRPEY